MQSVFFFCLHIVGRPLVARFLCTYDNDLYPTDLDYYITPENRQKKGGNLKAAAQIQRLYIL